MEKSLFDNAGLDNAALCLQDILDSVDDGIWIVDVDHSVQIINVRAQKFFQDYIGVAIKPGMKPHDVASDKEANSWVEMYDRVLAGEIIEFEDTILDGRCNWVKLQPVKENGRIIGISVFVREITERKKLEGKLAESEKHYRIVANHTADWEWWITPEGRFLYVSPACEKITGYMVEEFIKDPQLVDKIIHPKDSYSISSIMNVAESPEHIEEYRIIHRNGTVVWIEHKCKAVYDEEGLWLGRRASNRDITKRKEMEQELVRLASTDSLTGIANRRSFLELAAKEFTRAKRYNRFLSILILDIDHFKSVNDTYGHDAGDVVLKEFVGIAARSLRSQDLIGRLGGEEFGVLLPETNTFEAVYTAERIRKKIAEEPVAACGHTLPITVSIGVAQMQETDKDISSIIKSADQALYHAKQNGRNRVSTYQEIS